MGSSTLELDYRNRNAPGHLVKNLKWFNVIFKSLHKYKKA